MGQQPVLQTSFNSGEWAPALYARVDLTKYHSGAALLRNFFVDYRGGATTRPGTKFITQSLTTTTRLIPFQASQGVGYVLIFNAGTIRFIYNGATVLENATSIISAASGPPEVFTDTGHGYSNGDWLFIAGSYYIVANATTNTFTLTDTFGNAINTNPFTLPVNAQRVYTITTSYLASELALIKYAQDVNILILTHPNHPPSILTLNVNNPQPSWTFGTITFGSTITSPTGLAVATTAAAGSDFVAYVVTAVDANGQESAPTIPVILSSSSLATGAYTTTLTWNADTGAQSYNVYRSTISSAATIPAGQPYGFLGNATAATFVDGNNFANSGANGPNFAQTSPIVQNPFSGTGVTNVTLTSGGANYTSVPSVALTAAPGGGVTALALAALQLTAFTLGLGGQGQVGDILAAKGSDGGMLFKVTTSSGNQTVTGIALVSAGSITAGSVPASPITVKNVTSGSPITTQVNVTAWNVGQVALVNPGTGYLVTPTVSFSGGGGTGAAATATLGAPSSGNPTVPSLIQQRLFLGGQILSPSQFNLSQPGAPFNFNTTFPLQDDNAIQETLTSTTLNTIKAAVPVSAGLLIFTDRGAWLINGGSNGSGIGAASIVANPQAYSGISDVPPILTPNDLLYVQSKGSIVRDLSYNFYLANYVGTDISILSSHLFYGYSINEWTWSEEPYKLAWVIRNDGVMLSLTFIKEQELIAWAQHSTQGTFQSVCSVVESTSLGLVDAVYVIAQRTVNGVQVNYVERLSDLVYPSGYMSSWQVDAGIGYTGAAAVTFTGAQHLAGLVCTGLADGVVINFTMPASGTFVFGPGGTIGLTGIASASIVTVGLAFTPTITTLPLDLGEPTSQGKRKKITGVSLIVNNTLGLWQGRTLASAVQMDDLTLGEVGSMTNALVTGLVQGMARCIIDPSWDVPGQFTITQPNPYPASVLGIVPEIVIGDDP